MRNLPLLCVFWGYSAPETKGLWQRHTAGYYRVLPLPKRSVEGELVSLNSWCSFSGKEGHPLGLKPGSNCAPSPVWCSKMLNMLKGSVSWNTGQTPPVLSSALSLSPFPRARLGQAEASGAGKHPVFPCSWVTGGFPACLGWGVEW